MSDRSGAGLVELAVLQTLEALTAGRPRAHVSSARAVAGIEERIGLGPTYGYKLLADLARPWRIQVRTVSGLGNFGSRDFPEPLHQPPGLDHQLTRHDPSRPEPRQQRPTSICPHLHDPAALDINTRP